MSKTILWTTEFKAQVKRLSRRHRKVFDDIEKLADDLETGPLYDVNRLQGVGGAPVYRLRRANSSDNSGKSGGFRIIYYETANAIYLLDICVRKDCRPIPFPEIRRFLRGMSIE